MDRTIESKIRYHQLYDCYKSLLTDKQKAAFEYYYLDDYSLSEIADLLQVSRNAVYEQITVATTYLNDYESKLHLLEKNQRLIDFISAIKSLPNLSDEIKSMIKILEIQE